MSALRAALEIASAMDGTEKGSDDGEGDPAGGEKQGVCESEM